jgi:hypothetical protein
MKKSGTGRTTKITAGARPRPPSAALAAVGPNAFIGGNPASNRGTSTHAFPFLVGKYDL